MSRPGLFTTWRAAGRGLLPVLLLGLGSWCVLLGLLGLLWELL